MKKIFYLMLAVVSLTFATACSSDDEPSQSRLTIDLQMPEGIDAASVTDQQIAVRNVSNGQEQAFTSPEGIELRPGLYDIAYTASYTLPNGAKSTLRGAKTSVEITGSEATVALPVYANIENDDFVISEIFFTGTLQGTGTQYAGDKYVKLYNNTDHVLYADGITFFESTFMTVSKYDYTPDLMATDVLVQALYTVPGSGTDHPVQPGEYFLICDNGMDHKTLCENSFDLSHADFEWYDETSNPRFPDTDFPVPNMDKWYCYTNTTFTLHNRGFRAFGIARMGTGKEDYLSNYLSEYTYNMVLPTGTYPMSGKGYRVPNSWVVDVVNCSVESEYQWNVTSPALDMGWTYCGHVDQDKTRYFKAVRRKVLYLREDGTPVLQDTNNSTADFNAEVTPSEIELQKSAIDVNGTKCSTLTYDGVMPRK